MAKDFDHVKDSGARQEFNTGSVRDTAEGKGMPHLLPGDALNVIMNKIDSIGFTDRTNEELLRMIEVDMFNFSRFEESKTQNEASIYSAVATVMRYIRKTDEDSHYCVMTRLGNHYANGAKKYAKHNWRKGQPVSRYYDSAMRHLWKLMDKMEDEDHAAALFWNLVAIVQTKLDVKAGNLPSELDDFPPTKEEVWG